MAVFTSQQVLLAAIDTIKAAENGFLITQGESGYANSRLVQAYGPEEDLTLWFGTHSKSRKVREIRVNNRVTVTFYDPKEASYVTVLGTAKVINDVETKMKYWRNNWSTFFPKGPENEDYILIRFEPTRIEIMNMNRDIAPEPYGLLPAVLVREADQWVLTKGEVG
jgi:general stress protein 26